MVRYFHHGCAGLPCRIPSNPAASQGFASPAPLQLVWVHVLMQGTCVRSRVHPPRSPHWRTTQRKAALKQTTAPLTKVTPPPPATCFASQSTASRRHWHTVPRKLWGERQQRNFTGAEALVQRCKLGPRDPAQPPRFHPPQGLFCT